MGGAEAEDRYRKGIRKRMNPNSHVLFAPSVANFVTPLKNASAHRLRLGRAWTIAYIHAMQRVMCLASVQDEWENANNILPTYWEERWYLGKLRRGSCVG